MGSFDDALRERLSAIESVGDAQTTWQKLYSARMREKAMQDQTLAQRRAQYQSMVNANQQQQNMSGGFGVTGGGYGGGGGFAAFKNAIGQKESSNNYGAVNRQSGALGKYQIMPGNLRGAGRGWDYEALGYDVSPNQFLHSPQIQEKIASYQLQNYYNKYGPAGAAIAWYAGPNAANRWLNSGQISRTSETGGYPSVFAYLQSILGRL